MRITDATFALIDTETGGMEDGDDLLEVAVHLYRLTPAPVGAGFFSTLVTPTKPIPPEASGIHGLIDEDFEYGKSVPRSTVMEQLADAIPDGVIPVAHNAEFDMRVLGWDRPHLCTWRMANHLTPEAPDFKLQTLRYYYGFKYLDVGNAHRADADLLVLAPVFFHLVALYRDWVAGICGEDTARLEKAEQVETMIDWAKGTFRLARPAFGKHKTWDALFADQGYLNWMLRLDDLSSEMRLSIARERKERYPA